jgi:hypothetical protein
MPGLAHGASLTSAQRPALHRCGMRRVG